MVSFLAMCNCQRSCHLTARQKIRKDSVLMSSYTRGSLCQAQPRIDGSTLLVSTNAVTTTVRYYHISMHYVKSECTKLIITGSLSRSSNKDCIKISQICGGYWIQVLMEHLRILLLQMSSSTISLTFTPDFYTPHWRITSLLENTSLLFFSLPLPFSVPLSDLEEF